MPCILLLRWVLCHCDRLQPSKATSNSLSSKGNLYLWCLLVILLRLQVPKHSRVLRKLVSERFHSWQVRLRSKVCQGSHCVWIRGYNTNLHFHFCAWTHGLVLPPGRFSNVSCSTSPWLREFCVMSASLPLVHQPQRTLLWAGSSQALPSHHPNAALMPCNPKTRRVQSLYWAAMARNPSELLVRNNLCRSFPCRAAIAKWVLFV